MVAFMVWLGALIIGWSLYDINNTLKEINKNLKKINKMKEKLFKMILLVVIFIITLLIYVVTIDIFIPEYNRYQRYRILKPGQIWYTNYNPNNPFNHNTNYKAEILEIKDDYVKFINFVGKIDVEKSYDFVRFRTLGVEK